MRAASKDELEDSFQLTGRFRDWEVYKKDPTKKEEAPIQALDAEDIQILQTYGQGAYGKQLKKLEEDLKEIQGRINQKMGIKESDTGLASPNMWDLMADRFRMGNEHPLLVARCTKIIKCPPLTPEQEAERTQRAAGGSDIPPNADEQDKYVINVRQTAKYVAALGDKVSPTDIEEGMRVGSVFTTRSYRASWLTADGAAQIE